MNSLFMIFQFYIAFDLKREQMIILLHPKHYITLKINWKSINGEVQKGNLQKYSKQPRLMEILTFGQRTWKGFLNGNIFLGKYRKLFRSQ